MQILVDGFGTSIRKTSERLVVRDKDKKIIQEVPFFDLDDILILSRGITLSSDVIESCAEQGIQIHFLTSQGRPFAKLVSPGLQATVATRRAQISAYEDGRGVEISKLFVGAKLRAQLNLVKYWAKNRRGQDIAGQLKRAADKIEERIAELEGIDGARIEEIRQTIMSCEGRAASVYWEVVKALVPDALGFTSRDHRGAQDPVNAVLNYGYGILKSEISKVVLLAGLEECAGFLHADRSGRPSFVLDFMEEFRQPIVDRPLISLLNKGFTPVVKDGALSGDTRRTISQAIQERLEGKDRYEGRRCQLRTIVQRQAHHLATYFRGERNYKPFVWSW
ncbi:CRISPR-associated endonuclease Cas1 [Tumebacillus avium]|uniref:CRISPR-associated endonuclease Cas1 n=1 Tax=Tumebacillus avium TaxID=1903704 RepID=A0A1Y0ILW3_9BACL|nr:CRISPR-associated endonuclease Cas1 [Tumebacillus avium]ARU61518.1 CRISPR-associated endonuclease Cas1 [Tumebacillus avium]